MDATPPKSAAVLLAGFVCMQHGTLAGAEDVMTEHLRREYLEERSCMDLRIMRNEVYARHGRKFYDPELSKYFRDQPWYDPKYEASEFPDDVITDIQRKNIYNIQHYEKLKECTRWKMIFNINNWGIIEWSAAFAGLAALVAVFGGVARMLSRRRRRYPGGIDDI